MEIHAAVSADTIRHDFSPTGAVLDAVMRQFRLSRPPLTDLSPSYSRIDTVAGRRFAQVWFRTRGCTYDRRGECTMCNYGVGPDIEVPAMVGYVHDALDELVGPIDELYVSPSGNLLDPMEVPKEALDGILVELRRHPAPRVAFETRPETVSARRLAAVSEALGGKPFAVGLGVESVNPWVQRFCINKPLREQQVASAIEVIHSVGAAAYVNVAIGSAFLNSYEATADAEQSTKWALGAGADTVLLFPLHVKPFTLLEWMWRHGSYTPPSLWTLVEVLNRLPDRALGSVNVSWYRHDYGDANILASPTSCPTCDGLVMAGLDAFRASPGRPALDQLLGIACCRDDQSPSASIDLRPLPERVLGTLLDICEEFGIDAAQYADAMATELRADQSWHRITRRS